MAEALEWHVATVNPAKIVDGTPSEEIRAPFRTSQRWTVRSKIAERIQSPGVASDEESRGWMWLASGHCYRENLTIIDDWRFCVES